LATQGRVSFWALSTILAVATGQPFGGFEERSFAAHDRATNGRAPIRRRSLSHPHRVSRGDKSGTDALEHRLWRAAAINPAKAGGGSWYRDIGAGMGAALNAAQAMGAYTISDRGTWLSFFNKGDLAVLVEGDPRR
jgi:ABC-type tungstate transport system permease subunit